MKIIEALPKILKVTKLYEGGQVTWDFDGAGFSIGTLQWNVKSGTVQPMIREMYKNYPGIMVGIFGSLSDELEKNMEPNPTNIQLTWAKSINDYDLKDLKQPWKNAFSSLIQTEQWKQIEIKVISDQYLQTAISDAKWSGVKTLRSLCMFFDMATQNGGMGISLKLALSAAKPFLSVMSDVKDKPQAIKDKGWLLACAGSRSLLAYFRMPSFALNTFKRKLGIIEGGYNWRKGELPQINEQVNFDATEYGITDEPIEDL